MTINSRVLEILEESRIKKDDGICYLLSLYYGYEPSYIPDILKQKINISKIVENEQGTIKWNIALFDGQETAFEWVKTEYVELFRQAGKATHVREALTRMKKLFAKNPEVRKEDVIEATKMYLYNTDIKYVRFPHYFIEKGSGVEKTSDLLDWIDKQKLAEEHAKGRVSNSNTLV